MTKSYVSGLNCYEPRIMKWLPLILFGIVAILMLSGNLSFTKNSNFIGWMIWLFLLIYSQIMSGDIIVYDSGLEVRLFRKKMFFDWDKVSSVNTTSLGANIYINAKDHDFLTRLIILYPLWWGRGELITKTL